MKYLKIFNNIYNSDCVTIVKKTSKGDICVYKNDNTSDIIEIDEVDKGNVVSILNNAFSNMFDENFIKIGCVILREEFLQNIVFNDVDFLVEIHHVANKYHKTETLKAVNEKSYLNMKKFIVENCMENNRRGNI